MARQLDELLMEALGVPEGPQREAKIADLCDGDVQLERDLRDVIAAHEAAPSGFLSPGGAVSRESARSDGQDSNPE